MERFLTVDEEVRARPATVGGEGESLLLGELIGQLPDQVDELHGVASGRDPEGGTGNEGNPIRGRILNDDPLHYFFELPDHQRLRFTVRRRRGR